MRWSVFNTKLSRAWAHYIHKSIVWLLNRCVELWLLPLPWVQGVNSRFTYHSHEKCFQFNVIIRAESTAILSYDRRDWNSKYVWVHQGATTTCVSSPFRNYMLERYSAPTLLDSRLFPKLLNKRARRYILYFSRASPTKNPQPCNRWGQTLVHRCLRLYFSS